MRGGALARGFACVYCDCGHDDVVAVSCKGRVFCPSCGAARMVDTAAWLCDAAIRAVQVRQWVLSLPYRVRALCAYDAEACAGARLRRILQDVQGRNFGDFALTFVIVIIAIFCASHDRRKCTALGPGAHCLKHVTRQRANSDHLMPTRACKAPDCSRQTAHRFVARTSAGCEKRPGADRVGARFDRAVCGGARAGGVPGAAGGGRARRRRRRRREAVVASVP